MTRRKLVIGVVCALAVGLLAGGGVVAYVELSDDSADVVARQLTAAHGDVQRTVAQAERAELLDDVQRAGRTARLGASRVDRRIAELGDVKDERYRDTAREALEADRALLTAIGQLADLDPLSLTDDWKAAEDAIGAARLMIEQAAPDVEALDLERPVGNPVRTLPATTEALADLITTANRKLAGWRRRVTRVKRQQREDLGVLRSYASSMRTHLGRYDELRDQLSDWINDVDADGATYDEAYDFLGTASSERAEVRQGISTLDAPSAIAGAHTRLVGVIDQAISAVDSAYGGIVEYQYDFEEEFLDYKETPGWRTFSSASDRIAREYQSARGAWDSAVANEEQAIKRRRLPRRPNV